MLYIGVYSLCVIDRLQGNEWQARGCTLLLLT